MTEIDPREKKVTIKINIYRRVLMLLGLFIVAGIMGRNSELIAFAGGDYFLPWPKCSTKIATQGYSGSFSHHQGTYMEYALDFDMDVGDDVAAVRGGRVSHIEDDNDSNDCGGRSYTSKANYVVIDHGDGTSALYLHLDEVYVDFDDPEVNQGQVIGTAGKTGWSYCEPHLHFQLQKTGNSYWQQSMPIDFREVDGDDLYYGKDVHSDNEFFEDSSRETHREECGVLEKTDEGIRLTFYCFEGAEHAVAYWDFPCNEDFLGSEPVGLGNDHIGGNPMFLSYDFLSSCGSGNYEVTGIGVDSGREVTISFEW